MPAFSTDDVLGNRLDFEIARDGFVRELRDAAVLRNAETWLRREGYRVVEMALVPPGDGPTGWGPAATEHLEHAAARLRG